MVLAGTSARGCCPACGAGWRRVVERTEPSYYSERKAADFTGRKVDGNSNYTSISKGRPDNSGVGYSHTTTTGWEPSCACLDAGPPVPCTVLDCFMGSGTTLAVAKRLGRHAIGIELNASYVTLATDRLRQDVLPPEVAT